MAIMYQQTFTQQLSLILKIDHVTNKWKYKGVIYQNSLHIKHYKTCRMVIQTFVDNLALCRASSCVSQENPKNVHFAVDCLLYIPENDPVKNSTDSQEFAKAFAHILDCVKARYGLAPLFEVCLLVKCKKYPFVRSKILQVKEHNACEMLIERLEEVMRLKKKKWSDIYSANAILITVAVCQQNASKCSIFLNYRRDEYVKRLLNFSNIFNYFQCYNLHYL